MLMKTPLIINESGDVAIYSCASHAELNLEPIDVKEGIYKGYDADGRHLKIEVKENKVCIDLAEDSTSHSHELETLLRSSLSAVGKISDQIGQGDLAGLIEESKIFLFRPPRSNMEIIKRFISDLFKKKT